MSRTPSDPPPSPRLLDLLRQQVRYMHYSRRTEQAYVHWVRAYIRYHGLRHPAELSGAEVEAFLSWLAADRQVAPSTHRQALSALLFLYQKVLNVSMPWMSEIGRPQAPQRLPVVLSHDEVRRLLDALGDIAPISAHPLLAHLLYGTGLRLMEALRLRVKDVDFDRRAIVVREGKGGKDRVVMLPAALEAPLRPTAPPAWPACSCRMRCRANTRVRPSPGPGSGSSRRPTCPKTRAAAPCPALRLSRAQPAPIPSCAVVVTTSSTRVSSVPSRRRCSRPASTSRLRRTRCAIPSPPTCCSPATTSAPCRNCWAMPT
jgi:Phage integrase, N-terminal SAM-like domain/Phage integrase family